MNAAEAMIGVSLFASIAVTVRAIAAIWLKRMELRHATLPVGAVEQRLERIEAMLDVIALEVERMTEAQRFAARLAADGRPGSLSTPGNAPEGRLITPH